MSKSTTAHAPMATEYLPLVAPFDGPWPIIIAVVVVIAAGFTFLRVLRSPKNTDPLGSGFFIMFATAVVVAISGGVFGWVGESKLDKNLTANIQAKYEISAVTLGDADNDIRQAVVSLPDGQSAAYALTYDKATGEPMLAATGSSAPSPSSLERK